MTITFFKHSPSNLRYYTIHDRQGNLFSPYTFTTVWGIFLNYGREKVYTFESRREMDKKLKFLINKRTGSGYKVLYSFSRGREYTEMFNSIRNVQAG